MTVKEVYNVLSKKSDYWGLQIFDVSSKRQIGTCNSMVPFETLPERIKEQEVVVLSSGCGGLLVGIDATKHLTDKGTVYECSPLPGGTGSVLAIVDDSDYKRISEKGVIMQ